MQTIKQMIGVMLATLLGLQVIRYGLNLDYTTEGILTITLGGLGISSIFLILKKYLRSQGY